MRTTITAFWAVALFLGPLLADTRNDCLKQTDNPGCNGIAMSEHWGSFDSIAFTVMVFVAFWLVSRLGARRLSKS